MYMWFCPRSILGSDRRVEVFVILDIWGISWQKRDYWLEHRVKSGSVRRLGQKTTVFVFLTGFVEVEGWLIPLLCPRSTFPFGWIDFGGIRPEERDDRPWHLLPRSAPKSTRSEM